MSAGSTIVITLITPAGASTDITNHVVFAETTFEAQMAAIPGAFRVVLKDTAYTLSFATGSELTLDIDGVRVYGGYVMTVQKGFFFVVDKATPKARKWVLTGVDYNILLDKRIIRQTSNYTAQIASVAGPAYDGAIIRTYFGTWFDIPSGFDFTNTSYVKDNHQFVTSFTPWEQGTTLRACLDDFGRYGTVFFIDASRRLNFLPVQNVAASWGFSDHPNGQPIGWGGGTPTIGFRDGQLTEDATAVVNDALVWGGTGSWTDSSALLVFARKQDSGSVTAHNRWQYPEVNVGAENYKTQAEVDARANVIVNGVESGSFAEGTKGMVNPEKQATLTWFNWDVPKSGGNPVHLLPSQVVYVELQTFSIAQNLPLRSVSISFPNLDATGKGYVQFTGMFGVLMSDPYWLWHFIRASQGGGLTTLVSTASASSTTGGYGSQWAGIPQPAPDGSTVDFYVHGTSGTIFSYIGGTTMVYLNGLIQARGTSYTESDPAGGKITFGTAPISSDTIYIQCVLAG